MSDQFYCKFLAIFGGFLGFLSFALPNWPPFPQINVLKYTLNKLFFFLVYSGAEESLKSAKNVYSLYSPFWSESQWASNIPHSSFYGTEIKLARKRV